MGTTSVAAWDAQAEEVTRPEMSLIFLPSAADFSQGKISISTAAPQTLELLVLLEDSPCSPGPRRRTQEGQRISTAPDHDCQPVVPADRLPMSLADAGSQVTPTAGSCQMPSFISAASTSGNSSPWSPLGPETQLLFCTRVQKLEFLDWVQSLLLIFFATAFHIRNCLLSSTAPPTPLL